MFHKMFPFFFGLCLALLSLRASGMLSEHVVFIQYNGMYVTFFFFASFNTGEKW